MLDRIKVKTKNMSQEAFALYGELMDNRKTAYASAMVFNMAEIKENSMRPFETALTTYKSRPIEKEKALTS